ncbi:Alpha-glucosidase [Thermoanaerobacter mathranii subsp. mathranii str. A3]|uniref:Alpha-glucosidase n=1 Tax=Thermoanaerobacter mathranii subsp. mathranii (strain DSM 11426 / CCUG 53645 / CIP 108742 / A3) TaxID=583358 RepID=A0ABM5LRY8_THEM3|nr:glycoside hydrolase family 31 protein [Thermoanaerobacter mathranii]ADH61420.1 Alpha-glucosidase [Thermoanaerobacter mathranii subsp. mathranii str. A3]
MIKENYLFKLTKNEDNVIDFKLVEGNTYVKVFVLEEDIIRFLMYEKELKLDRTWLVAPGMDDIEKEGRNRLDISPFSKPEYILHYDDLTCTIETSKIKLVINLNGMKTTWYAKLNGSEVKFASDRKTQAYNIEGSLGKGVFHYLERSINEQYYGLGEKAGIAERHGRSFKMMNVDAMGYDAETTDPLYKHVPFYITRNKETGISFGIFYDNLSTSIFDMGKELDNYHGYYRYYYAEDGDLDYYIILGPKIKDVTQKFSYLTGRTIFPPKWSIGYSGSSMHYTDAPNAQERLQKFIELCKKYDIPCDSFHLSSGYTSIGKKRYVFNWNRDKFPSPEDIVNYYHENGVKLCANIKPVLLIDHPMYKELEENKMFVRDKTGEKTEIVQFWDDLGAYVDFTNPKAYDWWKKQVTEKLLKYGIDSTWNDNNEYEIWDNDAKAYGFGKEISIGQIRPLMSLLMMKASYEAQKEYNPHIRPYLISRSGCPGMQRYVQTWSGDNRTCYKTIKFNIKMGIGLSLSGIYNFGHDVGGFAGPAPEPEMFVRWVQNGIFYPRFTIHSWNDDGTATEPWMYPEVLPYIRQAIKFRVKITPYIYNLLYRAHEYYEPIIRPTFYNFENDPKTFEDCDDFMLGDDMLIASVVEKGQYEREVYLPKHNDGWYDYHTGLWYEGGQKVKVPAPLDYSPLLIRGGAIIPINDADITFETKSRDERGFMIFPHKHNGRTEFKLYEDDGYTNDYKKGIFTFVNVNMDCDDEKINIKIFAEGKYKLPYDVVRIYLPKSEARQIIINGKTFDKNNENIYETYIG